MQKIKGVIKPTKKEIIVLRIMIFLGVLSLINFGYWFFNPKYIDNTFLYILLCIALGYTSLRILYEWYHYWSISIPEEKTLEKNFTVDFLTTYFPGEPYEMIEETLIAIKNVSYPHTTILCDEANDPYLKDFCRLHGIKHISRDNRIDAKAGNINNALQKIATGEICVILDPDHVPQPDFLDPIIPYFQDEKIGYVQVVQAYKNLDESYVAKGAAQQTFQFYGPMMMTMNSYGTVNAIGANCTFRRAALDSIGGHAPGLSEDMHTAMQLHAKGWKSVYVPKVLARGLVPASLTAYFKQQLKWSRGTLELLVSVYPKLFRHFTWRQKIHYGTIPLHYLIGIIYIINFLLPVIALLTSTTPWKGNIVFFGLITFPFIASLMLIRTFVQRWVMEENERGFHVVGGLLQISAWWVFCLGLVYTIFRKKVPYLPTPKTGDDKTSWKLLAPNIFIALLSVSAIIIGLLKDFSPFSIFMSGFAFLNTCFMLFSIYLGSHVYQDRDKIEHNIKRKIFKVNYMFKHILWEFRHDVYRKVRKVAFLVLIMSFLTSFGLVYYDNYLKWEGVKSYPELPSLPDKMLGIYIPDKSNGISNPKDIRKAELNISTRFDIISHYLPWGDGNEQNLGRILEISKKEDVIPMITWEPWASTFKYSGEYPSLEDEKEIFSHISKGVFDQYLLDFCERIKTFREPVYIRFAHEFDNPSYPWSTTGDNTPAAFKEAWKYLVDFFRDHGAHNVKWIWSPWKPKAINNYYPGDNYVDYVAFTALNYGILNPDGKSYSLTELYLPLRNAMIAASIKKPVIFAEFGSLKIETNQKEWLQNALRDIYNDFPEVKGIVFFDSKIDYNIPETELQLNRLDWSIANTKDLREELWTQEETQYGVSLLPIDQNISQSAITSLNRSLNKNIIGISYKKGQNWYKNYQVMDRRTVMSDIGKMKDLGLNTIKYYGSNVYNYNMFNAAEFHNMKLIYGLWIPDEIGDGFHPDENYTKDLLAQVKRLRNEKNIIAWNLGNDILTKMESYYKSPKSEEAKSAYLKWLNDLVYQINAIDGSRPVIIDIEVNRFALKHTKLLLEQVNGIGLPGITIREKTYLDEYLAYLNNRGICYMVGDVEPQLLTDIKGLKYRKQSFIIRNWQDQHESNLVTFDGIVDHQGHFKNEYFSIDNYLNLNSTSEPLKKVKILKPAALLYPGHSYEYYALIQEENEKRWSYTDRIPEAQLEWNLVKCDNFGNPLALKIIGHGKKLDLKIPQDYENYRLVLKYTKDDQVSITEDILNSKVSDSENSEDTSAIVEY
ncbi:glycosyltransferase [Robertkochia solimangrovi]|uniref:glycosyltransferase n=1 Tax=Robertkochia solimangrovi TaxID=2213046 RepID=UPI00117E74F5|nr:glycosyltransferase [Robertkochia solimangrovi]TRZ44197.1 cellulose synthase [Robertkochia solimangrovi]